MGALGSLDDLVGATDQREWEGYAKSFGRLEVQHQFDGRHPSWEPTLPGSFLGTLIVLLSSGMSHENGGLKP